MISYPLTLPSPLLSSGNGGSKSTVKEFAFDYRRRTVRQPRERMQVDVSLSLSDTELDEFIDNFYDVIAVSHNFTFLSDWYISANDNIDKVLRVISQPTIRTLSKFRYNVTFNIEVLSFGTDRALQCPNYTFATLTTSQTLETC